MATDEQGKSGPAHQKQDSRQSATQGEPKKQSGQPAKDGDQNKAGIGSSQGQDRGASEPSRPSAGTADIERGGGSQDIERGGSNGSLVNDPVGAFKERP